MRAVLMMIRTMVATVTVTAIKAPSITYRETMYFFAILFMSCLVAPGALF